MSNTSGLYGDDDSPQPASTGLYTDGDVTTTTSNNTTGLYPENTFTPSTGGDAVVDGSLVVRENLSVGGDTVLNGNLNVGGDTTFTDLIVNNNLTVGGAATIAEACIGDVDISGTTVSTCPGSTTDLTLNSLTGQISVAAANVSIAQGTTIKYNENNTTSNSPTFQSTSGDASSVRVRAPSATTSASANITALNSSSTTDNKFVSVQARGSATTPLRINIGQTVGGVSGATTSKLAFTNFGTAFAYANPAGTVDNLDYATKQYVDTNDDDTKYTIGVTAAGGGANLNLTGTDATTDTVLFANGTGVTVAETGASTMTVSIGQDVATNADVTFASVIADSLAVDTGATVAVGTGEFAWNATNATVDLGLENGVVLQLGQEQHVYGKATEPIANGQVVMFAGAQGAHVLFALADTTVMGFIEDYIIGVATQDFTTNQFGYVTTMGSVRGLDTSAYNEGDLLWLANGVPGALTTTQPSKPGYQILVAAVTRVNPSQGEIYARPTHNPGLGELRNVTLSSPANGDVLTFNSTTGVWENTPASPANPFDQDLNTFDSVQFTNVNIGGFYSFPPTDGTNAQILATTGTGATYWTDASAYNQDYSNTVDTVTGGANLILREAVSPMGYIVHSTTNFDSGTGITVSTTGPSNITITNDGVLSVNGQTGVAVLDTDDVSEGATNLYFTTARARNSISATGDISYDSVSGVISYTAPAAPVTSVNGQTGAVVLDTDDISEGTTNLYFTQARARSSLSGGTGVIYTTATGVIAIGQDVATSASPTFVNGTFTGVVNTSGGGAASKLKRAVSGATGSAYPLIVNRQATGAARVTNNGPHIGFEYWGTDNTEATSPVGAIRGLYDSAGENYFELLRLAGSYSTGIQTIARMKRGDHQFKNTSGFNSIFATDANTSIIGQVGTSGFANILNVIKRRTDVTAPTDGDKADFRIAFQGNTGTFTTVGKFEGTYDATNGHSFSMNVFDATGATSIATVNTSRAETIINALPTTGAPVAVAAFRASNIELLAPTAAVRLTSAEIAALTPVGGWIVFNTTTNKLQCYDGTVWQDLF